MGPKLVVTSYVLGRLRVVVKYLGGRRTRDRRLGEATLTAAPARDRHVAVRDVTDTSPTTFIYHFYTLLPTVWALLLLRLQRVRLCNSSR